VLFGWHSRCISQRRAHRASIEEKDVNWDRIEGNWKQLKGKIKEQWGKLTDDDIDRIAGQRDQLAGSLQEAYGIGKDEAEQQIDRFADRWEHGSADDEPLPPPTDTARPAPSRRI
jgi:uncharacterized protein YjbJ (UPF0337 family)